MVTNSAADSEDGPSEAPPPASLLAILALFACGPEFPGDTTTTADTTNSTSTTMVSSSSSTAPTSTTTGTSSASTTSTTSEPCSFLDCIPTQDGCNSVGVACDPCDVWSQDCPDGQKCAPYANDGSYWNDTICVDITPNPGKPGDPCTVEGGIATGKDTCEKAALCWDVDPVTFAGTCVGFCMGSQGAPICPIGTQCVIANDGVLILCIPGCNPLTQDCPNMDLCIPDLQGGDFVCVLKGSRGGQGKQNESCEFLSYCEPGLACVDPALATECDPMAAGCCLPFCDLSNPSCTNQGAMCLPWYDPGTAPPGLENVGLCSLMP